MRAGAAALAHAHVGRGDSRFPPGPVDSPWCWLCGGPTDGHGVARRKLISGSFTDNAGARAPQSEAVCAPCAWSLQGKPGARPPPARMLGWHVGPDACEHPTRSQWSLVLRDPGSVGRPFAVVIPVSGQKHLLFKAPVNHDRRRYRVQLEDLVVDVEVGRYSEMLSAFETLYSGGFRKAEIETGRYDQRRILRFGRPAWQALEVRLAPSRGSALFSLVAYVAQRQEVTP